MIYGFVVAAFLIINVEEQAQHIPFATVEACQKAAEQAGNGYVPWARKNMFCVSTGATHTTAPPPDG